MLVLSRKTDEKIVIPDLNIEITVVRLSHTTVRLGFNAPPDVNIVRRELMPTQQEETAA